MKRLVPILLLAFLACAKPQPVLVPVRVEVPVPVPCPPPQIPAPPPSALEPLPEGAPEAEVLRALVADLRAWRTHAAVLRRLLQAYLPAPSTPPAKEPHR